MQLRFPETSLIVLAGASGSGKSSFARKWFAPSEIVSSDQCRLMVSNDENSLDASADAFDLLHYIIGKRLKRGLLTVVDATNIRSEDRKRLVQLAREHYVLPAIIVLNMPESVVVDRSKARSDRKIPARAAVNHVSLLRRGLGRLKTEGFRRTYEFRKPDEVEAITEIIREKLWNDRREDRGPFDIIGDVHGCYAELVQLLDTLGYQETDGALRHPGGRRLIFLGDLVDRGPDSPSVLRLVMRCVAAGTALCVPGNHDVKLLKWLNGKSVQLTHGLDRTVAQIEALPDADRFKDEVRTFLEALISHYILDEGKLVVAHAGLKEAMHGRASGTVREFCLYGETTGEIDEFGMPVRQNWAAEYRGKAMVIYGHTPVPEVQWLNHTADIDTGCVFGGKLTAMRYPEQDLVSVPAAEVYCEPVRPLIHVPASTTESDATYGFQPSLQQAHDDLPDMADLSGKLLIETRLMSGITIQEGNGRAALEAISRFAVQPKWLMYLPPTMSPCETSPLPGFLEHPAEAFSYFKAQGVTDVICEEKHMGSRAVVIICRDAEVVRRRFGIDGGDSIGICYTRTGRRFFPDLSEEQAFLNVLQHELTAAGAWEQLETDWICLDAELMPWSAKAQALIQSQYAAVGAASVHATAGATRALEAAVCNGVPAAELLATFGARQQASQKFVNAYRQYCWPVDSLADYKLAPFHILATEGRSYFDRDHRWHMDTIAGWCGDGLLKATPYKIVSLADEAAIADATAWWEAQVGAGREGMVAKPLQFIARNSKGSLIQPAVKVRGPEYLRIIYGPDYDAPANLNRLKQRGLNTKRALALREFALGVGAVEAFVRKSPLREMHRNVFGILALESEAVDPRL